MRREMWTALAAFLLLMIPAGGPAEGETTRQQEGTQPTQGTSTDDKEIISVLEVLENYDLLKDMDEIKYFPFLARMKEEEGENP